MPLICVDDAREYFAHPSQWLFGLTPDRLPEDGIEYRAAGGLCAAFHDAPWPNVVMAHYGAKPESWGMLECPAMELLHEAWHEYRPERIIGWTQERNRLAVAFARRLGFTVDGRMDLPSGAVLMQGWRP